MNCNSDIKQTVLRGVYEDNLSIQCSCARKTRTSTRKTMPVMRKTRAGWPRRLLGGILALLGVCVSFPLAPVSESAIPLASADAGALTNRQAVVPVMPDGDADPWNTAGPWTSFEDRLLRDSGTLLGAVALTNVEALEEAELSLQDQSAQYAALLSQTDVAMADLFGLKVQTIVIDPGHGGIDPGATGPTGLKEKEVALEIARDLRNRLASNERYDVLLTRDEDEKVFLKERVAFAKQHQADLFISIHANWVPSEDKNFVETYFFGPHADQESLDLAEKENRDSDYAMGDFREIIAKIGDTLKTEESRGLAKSIQKHLYGSMKRDNTDLVNVGTKAGPFVVLLGVEVPSVLVEVSCISNKAEETRLSTPEYRRKIAGFLETGIIEYLNGRAYKNAIAGGQTQDVVRHQ